MKPGHRRHYRRRNRSRLMIAAVVAGAVVYNHFRRVLS
jgi:hypothetical protein